MEMVISGSIFGRWGIWQYDSGLDEASHLSSSQATSWIQKHKTGSPGAFQSRESKLGSLMRSGQNLAFWTTSLETEISSHFKIEKHLVLIHLSKVSSVSPRGEKSGRLQGQRGSFQMQSLPLFNSCN